VGGFKVVEANDFHDQVGRFVARYRDHPLDQID
jgi:hypothetical protein